MRDLDAGVWFRAGCSGLWYQNAGAAGSIVEVRVDGVRFVPACLDAQDDETFIDPKAPDPDDLDPAFCHRCGDYCTAARVDVMGEWLCPSCVADVCPECCHCHQPIVGPHFSDGKLHLCDGCAAGAEEEGDRRREKRE